MRAREFTFVSLAFALLGACASNASQPDGVPRGRGEVTSELCTVPAGATVALATEVEPQFVVVTDQHVYFSSTRSSGASETWNLFRVGASTPSNAETVGILDTSPAFAIAGSVVLTITGSTPTLAKIGVDGESGDDVSNGVGLGPGVAAFDGTTLFASFPAGAALAAAPLSGRADVVPSPPILGLAALGGTAYVATYDAATSDGAIATYTAGEAAPARILSDLGAVSAVAVDSDYLYFTSVAGTGHTAIYRALPNGVGRSVVVDDVGGSFAVAGPNVYYADAGRIARYSENSGKVTVLATYPTGAKPLVLVRGGNVFWAYGSYASTPGSAPTPGAIATACR